ncbi:hypothetical protein KO507_02480 [Gilvimarinus agarilyticus]|uniref:hypothetical protein n=1 Tax=Gilvimarinus sp. 2_MG-2023 TaxID=3062666 RepID=UPI001C09C1F1|nr:hypothetical protein [Gilvimarinus sp. 2_MG-2023]MBU2884626.1 hypothetical protein [Gilvimarinus agarilyticus]MDO6569733.1 hypothetical protein [Gilvimarinus sp. 2_MG-2023]
MPKVLYPAVCNVESIFKFCDEIASLENEDRIVIDFSNMGRIEPFTMVYVAKFIRDYNRLNRDTTISCCGHKNKDYAANMAFFRAFGLKHGREPNCVDGNDRFVPFTILRLQTIIDEAMEEWEPEQEVIERRSAHLAEILAQEHSGNLVDALTYSIREIMRNVFEHSKSKSLEYCAQYWPYYNKVEIAILDNGVGLKKSLKENPHIEIKTHSDAIQQALMPAISSKSFEGAIQDTSDPWHNSGFGLYMINRICRLGGSFLICTGDHGIKLDEHGKHHIDLSHLCRGTAVRMVLNTSRLLTLGEMLNEFKIDGYEAARQIKGVGLYEASAASQMLSRDFKKNS